MCDHWAQQIREAVAFLRHYFPLRPWLLIEQSLECVLAIFGKYLKRANTFTDGETIVFIVQRLVGYVFEQCTVGGLKSCPAVHIDWDPGDVRGGILPIRGKLRIAGITAA